MTAQAQARRRLPNRRGQAVVVAGVDVARVEIDKEGKTTIALSAEQPNATQDEPLDLPAFLGRERV
jgi:hypothetical protein